MNQDNLFVKEPWVERNGFAHWSMVIFWWITALIMFQLVGGIIGGLLLIPEIMDAINNQGDIQEVFAQNLGKVFIGNSTGQFLIIGIGSYLLAKLHTQKGNVRNFLRLKLSSNVWKVTGITAILTLAIMPANGFLGWLNYLIFDQMVHIFPKLNWFLETQESMAEMIKGFIGSENAVILALIHIGFVPAIFEEIMFRGYFLGALEKSMKVLYAIILSGLLFGAFHLQPSNFVPLAMLGILFAYVTYVSDSLIPAMVAHLINNGGQVIYGAKNREFLEQEMTTEFDMSILLIIGSILVTGALVYMLSKMKTKEVDHV